MTEKKQGPNTQERLRTTSKVRVQHSTMVMTSHSRKVTDRSKTKLRKLPLMG